MIILDHRIRIEVSFKKFGQFINPFSLNTVDMAKKAKRTTSNQVSGSSEPLAWIQYEFKKPIYMTGFSFRQTRRKCNTVPDNQFNRCLFVFFNFSQGR